ncbi:isoprenylcysteine carboxylmethyltransferase family protein [Candidimonas humi]|uniref:Methyltransferase family protein n=1 Tax=Candidimonas humi TaxID=683355 RepID=A0ABV8NTW3_9BURK|nr:methyltransferase [Candidimonas humi]MBV6305149.1 isoprenylcysteine carboxylmethyltransferase family protein [Candidimonas humi]
MSRPTGMHYRNSFFYVLTQIIGISLLLGWLAYSLQHLGATGAAHMLQPPGPTAWGHATIYGRGLELAAHLVEWLVLPCLILVNGALALRGRNDAAARSGRTLFRVLFGVFLLAAMLAWVLRQTALVPHPLTAFGAHPSVGLALFGLYFSLFELYFAGWALERRRLRWLGLGLAVAVGLVLCLVYLMHSTHFVSETLWAAAAAWLLCSVLFFRLVVTRHGVASLATDDHTLEEIWKHLSTVQVQRRTTLGIYGVFLVCLVPFIGSAAAPESWPHESVEWVGLALIAVALLGRCWCILYLGGRKGAELMDQGPYSISRNPLYWFSMIAVTGIGAQSGSLLLGPIMALFVYAVFKNVIEEEERLLRKVFGPKFDAYCARVPRFGPRFAGWRSDEHLTVSMSGLWNTLRDALPYFLAIPLFELIEWAQVSGWLPVLIRLP